MIPRRDKHVPTCWMPCASQCDVKCYVWGSPAVASQLGLKLAEGVTCGSASAPAWVRLQQVRQQTLEDEDALRADVWIPRIHLTCATAVSVSDVCVAWQVAVLYQAVLSTIYESSQP